MAKKNTKKKKKSSGSAEVKITEDHERYAKAELVKLLKRSDDRISAPICPYLNRCGGCPLLQMKADNLIHEGDTPAYKRAQVLAEEISKSAAEIKK